MWGDGCHQSPWRLRFQKLAGENFVKDFADRYFIPEDGLAVQRDGKNFAKTMLRLSEDRDMVTVVGSVRFPHQRG